MFLGVLFGAFFRWESFVVFDRRTKGHNFEGVIKGCPPLKIEEVGEARRSMNAVEGLTDYGLQFTDANSLLTFIPLSR